MWRKKMELFLQLISYYLAGMALTFPIVLWDARGRSLFVNDGWEIVWSLILWPLLLAYFIIELLIDL